MYVSRRCTLIQLCYNCGVLCCRPVPQRVGAAVHGGGAALPGQEPQPAAGPAQRPEDSPVLAGGPAQPPPGGVLGHGPAEDQDGRLFTQVSPSDPEVVLIY